jgi:hypothetical protein
MEDLFRFRNRPKRSLLGVASIGEGGANMIDALTWAGTFPGIGATLLRDYAREKPMASQMPTCPIFCDAIL